MDPDPQKPRKTTRRLVTIEQYKKDGKFTRIQPHKPPRGRKRGRVKATEPSSESLMSLVWLLNNSDREVRSLITITFQEDVALEISPVEHKKILKAFLQQMRREYSNVGYVWVREFQDNESVHWHVFTTHLLLECGTTKDDCEAFAESKFWSDWVVNRCRKVLGIKSMKFKDELRSMREGDGKKFLGCCQAANLYGDAAGRYAAKEGGKRYQKVAPDEWVEAGGNWWDKSQDMTCTPTGAKIVDVKDLAAVYLEMPNGTRQPITLKRQWGHGTETKQAGIDYCPGLDDSNDFSIWEPKAGG